MKRILILLILMFPALGLAGTGVHYADCSLSTGDNDGSSPANAFQSIATINSHSFATGEDLYFKVGTTCDASSTRFNVDWAGSSGNQAIIGAYYGENQFGLNGNTRPIIDGNELNPTNQSGLIRVYWSTGSGTPGYVTIKDLHVLDSGTRAGESYGIEFQRQWESPGYGTDYNTVENCKITNSAGQGIIIARGSYNTIENNIIIGACDYGVKTSGASIEITAMGVQGLGDYNVVRGNITSEGYEGIGVYKGCRYTTIEKNSVRDFKSYHIYQGNSELSTIRYNLVYGSSSKPENERLIVVNCEGHIEGQIKVTGSAEIYNNLVAGSSVGITLTSNCVDMGPWDPPQADVLQSNNKVYNNIVVDCTDNYHFKNTGTGNLIKNNISWLLTGGGSHIQNDNCSPTGVTWDNNLFSGDPYTAGTGDCETNAVKDEGSYAAPGLSKTSGWRSLTAGAVTGNEFNFMDPDSHGATDGISIASYNDRITAADYTAIPISVTVVEQTILSVGAWASPSSIQRQFQRAGGGRIGF